MQGERRTTVSGKIHHFERLHLGSKARSEHYQMTLKKVEGEASTDSSITAEFSKKIIPDLKVRCYLVCGK